MTNKINNSAQINSRSMFTSANDSERWPGPMVLRTLSRHEYPVNIAICLVVYFILFHWTQIVPREMVTWAKQN